MWLLLEGVRALLLLLLLAGRDEQPNLTLDKESRIEPQFWKASSLSSFLLQNKTLGRKSMDMVFSVTLVIGSGQGQIRSQNFAT